MFEIFPDISTSKARILQFINFISAFNEKCFPYNAILRCNNELVFPTCGALWINGFSSKSAILLWNNVLSLLRLYTHPNNKNIFKNWNMYELVNLQNRFKFQGRAEGGKRSIIKDEAISLTIKLLSAIKGILYYPFKRVINESRNYLAGSLSSR